MTDRALAHLATPPGQPGSGLLRYGAAMALYGENALTAEALEVYRICAALDAEDPKVLLVQRGLPVPDAVTLDPEAEVRALIAEADQYLATLPGPGVAEVRMGVAAARGQDFHPLRVTPNAVLAAHLSAALAPLTATHPALAASIAATVPYLHWQTFDQYPADEIGADFRTGNAFCIIIGQDGPIKAQGFDIGLFLIAPHTLYRDHHHKAPELYAPLTGPHGWRFGPDGPLILKPAHEPVWNDPDAPHATKVGAVPFLCLYGWTADVDSKPQVIPAGDWAELEALRL